MNEISPLALKAKQVIEAQWRIGPAYDLATQAAEALEDRQMLQSPESVRELTADAVRVAEEAVAELRREHEESARLRSERDEFCNRVDTLTAVAKGNKRHVSEMFAELQKVQRERDEALARVADLEEALSVATGALRENRAELEAPARVREVPDGEFYAYVHHDHRLGHDLPQTGGAW
jgi:uncharacterized coiled-coil DUF342 family protein